jgi:hypothetical protein
MYILYSGMIWQRSMSRLMLAAIGLCTALSLISCLWSSGQSAPSLPRLMQIQPGSAYENRERDNRAYMAATVAQNPLASPTLLYSSYLGGDGVDKGQDVAVDAAGNIYIIGQTFSDTLFGSDIERLGYSDIFVAKFDPTGKELLYSVLIGGKDSDYPLSIDVDAQGNVYGTGYVSDETFPTQNARWVTPPENTNSVLFKLDGSSGAIVYSTYLPLDVFYSRHNLVVNKAGYAYVAGTYPWVIEGETYWRDQLGLVKLDPTGSEVLLDLKIGGTGTDRASAIALDDSGNIYLTGTTSEGDGFPVTANAHQPQCGDLIHDPDSYCYLDGLIVVLNPAGEVTYASYHGGSFTDTPVSIAADGEGNVVIAGDTASGKFPFVNAIQETCPIASYSDDCGSNRPFISAIHINADKATLTYSTYFGSTETNSDNVVLAATMDSAGNTYVTGYTSGKKFQLKDAIQDELYESFCYTFSSERYCFDAFITKFSPTGELLIGTYLGASYDEYLYGITVVDEGAGKESIYLTGTTEADDFPTTDNAYEPSNLLSDDAFLVKIGTASGGGTNTPPPPPPAGVHQLMLPVLLR